MNGTPASPATARASSVLPVPGGPSSSTPRGDCAPTLENLSGNLRKSTTSVSSSLDASQPATRRLRADLGELVGELEEVDDLGQLELGRVAARHVLERDARLRLHLDLRLRVEHLHRPARAAAAHAAHAAAAAVEQEEPAEEHEREEQVADERADAAERRLLRRLDR